MSKIEKLIGRLKQRPSDFTWSELQKVLSHFGYTEIKGKGSRRKFVNHSGSIISIHEPHPNKVLKRYVIEMVLDHLKLENDE